MSKKIDLSFEFFPPKTDAGQQKLLATAQQYQQLNPDYFSVTFGAGGSTRDNTLSTVFQVKQATGIDTAPHISGIGSSQQQIAELLQQYQQNGVNRLVVLRGDIPSGMRDPGDFSYAIDLVRFIRETTGEQFDIEVAAYPEVHPQAHSAKTDLKHFIEKVQAGANGAITQYFYNVDSYFYFVEQVRKAGIDIPIVPGIMPITNYRNIARFSDMCGAELPRWIRKQLETHEEGSADLIAFGQDVVTALCEKLIAGGVDKLHFYSMNQTQGCWQVCERLGLI